MTKEQRTAAERGYTSREEAASRLRWLADRIEKGLPAATQWANRVKVTINLYYALEDDKGFSLKPRG